MLQTQPAVSTAHHKTEPVEVVAEAAVVVVDEEAVVEAVVDAVAEEEGEEADTETRNQPLRKVARSKLVKSGSARWSLTVDLMWAFVGRLSR